MQRRGHVRNSSSNSAFVIANLCLRYIALMLAMLPNISPLQEQTQAICNNDSLQVMSASVRIGVQWNGDMSLKCVPSTNSPIAIQSMCFWPSIFRVNFNCLSWNRHTRAVVDFVHHVRVYLQWPQTVKPRAPTVIEVYPSETHLSPSVASSIRQCA